VTYYFFNTLYYLTLLDFSETFKENTISLPQLFPIVDKSKNNIYFFVSGKIASTFNLFTISSESIDSNDSSLFFLFSASYLFVALSSAASR